ncbi:MAG: trypsin-like peptidase domain-containing protein [Proteobacteria bacterium]|nr:trypsin-like peptidase domain-containing protein [Pseudomonadota bacterium]
MLRALTLALLVLHGAAAADASGTGFFVSADGLLVTNNHVIDGAARLNVQMADGSVRHAVPLVVDRSNDLAVLQVQGVQRQPFLQVRHSNTVLRGTEVFTIGFPLVSIQGSEPKVTHGIVSSLSGLADDPTMFQVSVPLQAGNSGGPLLALDGFVVGVVTAKLDAFKVQRATGDVPQNVNYAVKSAYLLELFGSRAVSGRVRHQAGPASPSSLSDVVRRAEPAVVLVRATVERAPEKVAAASLPGAPGQIESPAPETEPLDSYQFHGISFRLLDAYLEVRSVPPRSNSLQSTLRTGDRLLECVKYPAARIYRVDDIGKCRADFEVNKEKAGDMYILKVLRLGEPMVASIIVKKRF